MERTLCVLFADWALRRPDAPADRPVIVVGDGEVVAANRLARELDVEMGMARREGEALCATGVVLERDLASEMVAFEPIVQAIEDIVPRVEIVEPGLAYVPVGGAVRYYGGEEQLVEVVLERLSALPPSGGSTAKPGGGSGTRYRASSVADHRPPPSAPSSPTPPPGGGGADGIRNGEGDSAELLRPQACDGQWPSLGLARGPFAAYWAARTAEGVSQIVTDDARFLAELRVDTLPNRDLVDTFRWLGIHTLGNLATLPREAVLSRFGGMGLDAHRLASGEDRALHPRIVSEDLSVRQTLEEPLQYLEQVGFLARSMAHRLMATLRTAGVAPHELEVEATAVDGTVKSRVWRSADPFTEEALAERVWWQLRAWTESGGVPGGLVALRLTPTSMSGAGRQLVIFEDTTAALEAERALARAQALVGPDAVLQAVPQGGRDPADRFAWHRWGEEPDCVRPVDDPWPGSTPAPSPALVPPDPTPLMVDWEDGIPVRVRLRARWVEVLNWAGPWRRTGRWWRSEPDADRYQLVTSAGAFLCEVRSDGTFLTGVYD